MLKHDYKLESSNTDSNSTTTQHHLHTLKTPKNYNSKDSKTPKTVGKSLALRDITNSSSLKLSKLLTGKENDLQTIDGSKLSKVQFDDANTIITTTNAPSSFAFDNIGKESGHDAIKEESISTLLYQNKINNYLDIDNLDDDQIPDIEYAPIHLDDDQERLNEMETENDYHDYDWNSYLRPKDGIMLKCHEMNIMHKDEDYNNLNYLHQG